MRLFILSGVAAQVCPPDTNKKNQRPGFLLKNDAYYK